MASPGYRRCPQDTAYPQDTDSILRIPRYPQDTAGVLRYKWLQDASGILRIPCPQDAPRVPGRQTAFTDASCLTWPVLVPEWMKRSTAIVRELPLIIPPRAQELGVKSAELARRRSSWSSEDSAGRFKLDQKLGAHQKEAPVAQGESPTSCAGELGRNPATDAATHTEEQPSFNHSIGLGSRPRLPLRGRHRPWMVIAGYQVGCDPCFSVPL